MSSGLPPPPTRANSGDFAWVAWYNQLYSLLSTTGSINWDQVNKDGSSIADLQHKEHNLLTSIQGGSTSEHYHLTLDRYNVVTTPPAIEVAQTSGTVALTTTPALLKPATTVYSTGGLTYDSSTGEFTFQYAGNYNLALSVNATASAANQFVYIYAENDTGSGWTVTTNSGKAYELTNANTAQIVYSQAVRRTAGQKVRYKIYSNDVKVSLGVTTLPGGVGAIVPAIRVQYTG